MVLTKGVAVRNLLSQEALLLWATALVSGHKAFVFGWSWLVLFI